jgi:Pyridoxamine 5'-phosphate oxidase
MARWQDVMDSEPEFAQTAKAMFDRNKHKLLATLRKDGSPRISGIETIFTDGDLWLGMMPGSMKLRDLQRDGRFALHTSSENPSEDDPGSWTGDAKVSGEAVEIDDDDVKRRVFQHGETAGHPPEGVPLFRLDLHDVVIARIGEPPDHMVVELWKPGQGVRRTKRA